MKVHHKTKSIDNHPQTCQTEIQKTLQAELLQMKKAKQNFLSRKIINNERYSKLENEKNSIKELQKYNNNKLSSLCVLIPAESLKEHCKTKQQLFQVIDKNLRQKGLRLVTINDQKVVQNNQLKLEEKKQTNLQKTSFPKLYLDLAEIESNSVRENAQYYSASSVRNSGDRKNKYFRNKARIINFQCDNIPEANQLGKKKLLQKTHSLGSLGLMQLIYQQKISQQFVSTSPDQMKSQFSQTYKPFFWSTKTLIPKIKYISQSNKNSKQVNDDLQIENYLESKQIEKPQISQFMQQKMIECHNQKIETLKNIRKNKQSSMLSRIPGQNNYQPEQQQQQILNEEKSQVQQDIIQTKIETNIQDQENKSNQQQNETQVNQLQQEYNPIPLQTTQRKIQKGFYQFNKSSYNNNALKQILTKKTQPNKQRRNSNQKNNRFNLTKSSLENTSQMKNLYQSRFNQTDFEDFEIIGWNNDDRGKNDLSFNQLVVFEN